MAPVVASEPGSRDLRAPSRAEFLRALFGTEAPGHVGLWRLRDKSTLWLTVARLDDAARVRTTEDLYFTVALHDVELALKLGGETDPARVRGSIDSAIVLPGFYGDFDVRGPAHKRQDLPPTFEEGRALIARFPLRPTAILHTGYGLQAWWLLQQLWHFGSPEDRERAKRLLGRFHATLAAFSREQGWSLDNVSDLARVLRLPETFNNRLGERVPVEFEEWCPENRYELSELEAVLVEETAQPPESRVRVDTAQVLAGVPEGQRDTELFRLASKLRRAEVPREWAERLACEAAARCEPPFPEKEALAKVASAYGRYEASVSSVSPRLEPFGEIRQLPPVRPEAPSLPPELLPRPLQSWLADVADRMQVPLEFPAVPAVVSLAAVVGRRVGIRPKAEDDWLVVPNLWGAIIARPGLLKSPALAEALRPIRRLVANARNEHQRLLLEHGARLESLRAKEAALKSLMRQAYEGKTGKGTPEAHEATLKETRKDIQELEGRLRERRYITNDPTVEKLGELLAANPMGLLLERDELAGWLRALEKKDRQGDREFYLEAWNGTNPYDCDRIGRGSIHIPALCLSIVGGIQPAKLARYVAEAVDDSSAADGLLQRFQVLVWPEDQGDWRLVDRAPERRAREAAFEVFAAIDRCEPDLPPTGDDGIPALSFAGDAQELFYDWLSRLEGRLRSGSLHACPAFESHLAKYRSLMPALALLFHLVEMVDGGASTPVSLAAGQLSADWCEFLELHARKVYAAELGTDLAAAHTLAAEVRKGEIHDGLAVRDLYRPGWSHLKTPDAVFGGLRVLEDHGWLRVELTAGTGRPSQAIRLNPAAKEGNR